jgi:hypothetical protein
VTKLPFLPSRPTDPLVVVEGGGGMGGGGGGNSDGREGSGSSSAARHPYRETSTKTSAVSKSNALQLIQR